MTLILLITTLLLYLLGTWMWYSLVGKFSVDKRRGIENSFLWPITQVLDIRDKINIFVQIEMEKIQKQMKK